MLTANFDNLFGENADHREWYDYFSVRPVEIELVESISQRELDEDFTLSHSGSTGGFSRGWVNRRT